MLHGIVKWLDNLDDMEVYGVDFKVILNRTSQKFYIKLCWRRVRVLVIHNLGDNEVKYGDILQYTVTLNRLTAISNTEHGIYENLVDQFGYSVNENRRLVKRDLHDNEVKFGEILQCSVTVDELTALCIIEHIEFGCT